MTEPKSADEIIAFMRGQMPDITIQNNPRLYWNMKFEGSVSEWKIDYPPETLFAEHRLQIPKGKLVLDYGVGRGDFARFCVKNGNRVICCDVSDVALQGVKDSGAEQFVLYENIAQLPPVDLAVANLVFQHCPDDVVVNIMRHIKLNRHGIFSFQFAEMQSEYLPWVKEQEASGYLTFRSPDRMNQLIEKAGNLTIVGARDPIVQPWPGIKMVHHFFKCISK